MISALAWVALAMGPSGAVAPAPAPAPMPAPAPTSASGAEAGSLAPAPAPAPAPEAVEPSIVPAAATAEPLLLPGTEAQAITLPVTNVAPARTTVVVTRVVHTPPPAPPPPPRDEPTSSRARGFVGLSLRGSTTNRNPSTFVGGRAAFTFNDRFTIGAAYHALTARFGGPIVDPEGREVGMRMGYGSLLLSWNLYRGRVVHVAFESMAGAGAACITKTKRKVGRWKCLDKVGFVALEPGLDVGFTVTDALRVGVNTGYRYVVREAWSEPNDFTLSGPYLGLSVDIGRFRGE